MSTIKSSAENLTLNADGANNDIKFQSNGSEVASIDQAGVLVSSGGSTHADNVKAKFGTGNDLEIYHDATDSYVKDNGTGNLLLQGTNLNLQSTAAENYIRCTADAQVELYHNNVKKLETTAAGVTVTGALAVTGTVDGVDIQTLNTTASAALPKAGGTMTGTITGFTSKAIDDNSNTKVMTIDSDGGIVFATSSDASRDAQIFIETSASDWIIKYNHTNNSSAQWFERFMYNGSVIGGIQGNGSSTSFNTSSDYRLKENVDYDWDATTRLKQLKPARFNFIVDDTNTLVDGFIAHEAATVVPEAVTGTKDAMTAEVLYVEGDELPEGKVVGDVKTSSAPDMQGIDQSKLVPLLVKTIQELEARITALEA